MKMQAATTIDLKAGGVSAVHLLSPILVLSYYSISSIVFLIRNRNTQSDKPALGCSLVKGIDLGLTAGVVLAYISESVLRACTHPRNPNSTDGNLVYTLYSTLAWIILLLGLIDADKSRISYPFYGSWALTLVFDTTLLSLSMPSFSSQQGADIAWLVLRCSRLACLCGLLGLIGLIFGKKFWQAKNRANDEETAPLLANGPQQESTPNSDLNGNVYGGVSANGHADSSLANGSVTANDASSAAGQKPKADDEDDDEDNEGKMTKGWWVYAKAFKIFMPYMWPSKNIRLQLHFPALAVCLLADRVLNVLMPLQLGRVVDTLGKTGSERKVPWIEIGTFILIRFLESSAGISLVRSWLWLPIDKYATQQLNIAAYDQIMNLSCDFHDSKKSGSTWQTVVRGSSISGLFHVLSFELFPMAADLVIAISVFGYIFDAYMAFIVACAVVIFLWSTAKTISLKTKRQRDYIKTIEEEYEQMTESSLNWTTVSYFNRIKHEMGRYATLVNAAQTSLIRYQMLQYIVSALRSFTLLMGLLAACCLAANQIIYGDRGVGDFVVLLTYWGQLSSPLHYFASGFSRIAHHLVDAEKLLELLKKKPTICDSEKAREFILTHGAVEFQDVSFSYDGKRQVTKDISFRGEPGQTVALVGESGGGKSTILKLLFRFYDVTAGRVLIDGQDLRDVTLSSLRENIGVVPQDPVLFNQTILENLRYANLEASEDKIHDACKAVALHDKIMSFTKNYGETVGERGIKMSGGELQRMAIARAILKDPKILLLDEATSSVDSETEAQIQESLKKLCAGRTTFVIAHRLSTILHADLVLVIKNGEILERGTHEELMQVDGHYNKLWTRQIKLQAGDDRPKSSSSSSARSTPVVFDDAKQIENNCDKTEEDADVTARSRSSLSSSQSQKMPAGDEVSSDSRESQ